MPVVYRNEQSFCGPISTLKKLDNGELVLVFREARWRGFSTHGDPTTRTSMLRSDDEGETWHSHVTPDGTGAQGVSINQLSDGILIVNNFHFKFFPPSQQEEAEKTGISRRLGPQGWIGALDGIYVTRSADRGYTWEGERKIETPVRAPRTAGRIIELEDGTLLMPMEGNNSEEDPCGTWVLSSDDRGDTWAVRGVVAEIDDPNLPRGEASEREWRPSDAGFHETRLVEMPSGRILIGMRAQGANFFTAYSDDRARTWSQPEETPIFCNGSSPFDLLLLDDGRVLATYGHRRLPWGVRACLSEDEGRTWDVENEIVIRDDGIDRDMGYPSSQQMADGSILTVHYWHHEDQIRHLVSSRWTLG